MLYQSVMYQYREFFICLVVSEVVWEKFCTGKGSRNRYWKNMVPKKVSELVTKKKLDLFATI